MTIIFAERQPTDTSSPMPVDVARDLLAVVRALEARVAVLEDLLASAIAPPDRVAKPRHWPTHSASVPSPKTVAKLRAEHGVVDETVSERFPYGGARP